VMSGANFTRARSSMVERLPFKEKVGGPIPPGLTSRVRSVQALSVVCKHRLIVCFHILGLKISVFFMCLPF
jgi:hypothetical protein